VRRPAGRCTFSSAAPGVNACAPSVLRAALALQGIGLRPIPAALGLAPLWGRRTSCAGSATPLNSPKRTQHIGRSGCGQACPAGAVRAHPARTRSLRWRYAPPARRPWRLAWPLRALLPSRAATAPESSASPAGRASACAFPLDGAPAPAPAGPHGRESASRPLRSPNFQGERLCRAPSEPDSSVAMAGLSWDTA